MITENHTEAIGTALTRLGHCVRRCGDFVIEARCHDLSGLVVQAFDSDSSEEIIETITHLRYRLRDSNPLTELRRPYLTALVAAIETQIAIATKAQS